jgi:hypothetical protein
MHRTILEKSRCQSLATAHSYSTSREAATRSSPLYKPLIIFNYPKLCRAEAVFKATSGDVAARFTGRPAGLQVESVLRWGMARVNETSSEPPSYH